MKFGVGSPDEDARERAANEWRTPDRSGGRLTSNEYRASEVMQCSGEVDAILVAPQIEWCAFAPVVLQRLVFETAWGRTGGVDDSPPTNARAVAGHDPANGTRSRRAESGGDATVGHDLARRDSRDDVEHALGEPGWLCGHMTRHAWRRHESPTSVLCLDTIQPSLMRNAPTSASALAPSPRTSRPFR